MPQNAAGITFNTDELVTELFLDGEPFGTRISRPFFWSIPEKYRGKRLNMEIRRRTSIGPSFGNVLQFRNYHPTWPGFYSGQYPIRHFIIEPEFKLL